MIASNASGQFKAVAITPTYNQTSTAGATDLLINRTETAVGTGEQSFIDAQVAGQNKFIVLDTGSTGISTSTPWAKLSVAGVSLANTTHLVDISTSTASATTTVFEI